VNAASSGLVWDLTIAATALSYGLLQRLLETENFSIWSPLPPPLASA